MPDSYSAEQRKRLNSYLKIHLKEEELGLPEKQRISMLEKKNRKQNWFLVINVAAVLFFGYSFFFDITQLSNTLLYILGAVFIINVGMIYYQKKQLQGLIGYLQWKQQNNDHS